MKLRLFTKKDKRTKLEKEIDSVLDVMSNMKASLKSNGELTDLDNEINSVLASMAKADPKSEEYMSMVKALDILYKAKANGKTKLEEYSEMTLNLEKLYKAKEGTKKPKIPKETVLIVIASLAELLIMLYYEKANVITSKAFSRLLKVRV
jgi:tRNA U34 5-carboxymethylaminomethyl modifying GTPase MnmE/TrmE